MKYWDSSALVPLFVQQAKTSAVRRLLGEDPDVVSWWVTSTECASAILRLSREGSLTDAQVSLALQRLRSQQAGWRDVMPSDSLRSLAERLLRVHTLRAADALQLAAALAACAQDPDRLPFVCLDDRLRAAAAREGFRLAP